jgi:hypothetical protein
MTHRNNYETYKQTTLTKTTTKKTTVKTTNDSKKDGLPIIVGASVGGVIIAVAAVVSIYLYKR